MTSHLERAGRLRESTRGRCPAAPLARLVAACAVLAGSLAVVPAAGVPVGADPAGGPGAFSTTATGTITSGPVPDGTCAGRVSALGGAGGSAVSVGSTGGRGGPAARINATFAVLPLQVYSGSVGGGGGTVITGGVGGGGAGADAPSNHDGAGGGGRTVVTIGGVNIVVAGGGGGAGAAHQATPAGNAGAAGSAIAAAGVVVGSAGSNGSDSTGVPGGGQGGQAALGGAGGVHSNTPARSGFPGGAIATGTGGAGGVELTFDAGGGGGAGYTGGGGGASTVGESRSGAGGGGGSSFVANSPIVAATAPSAVSGAAGATPALGAAGANGDMSIDWLPCLYDLTVSKAASATSVNAGGRITWTISVTNNGPDPMTRGDILTLTDTLPSGSNATSPSPNNVVTSITTSGGSNANLLSGAVTCTGLTVGATMPATTDCTRPYAAVVGTPGSPTGGSRGLNSGETLTITYDQIISNTAACSTITNTATVRDRPTQNTSTPTNITGNVVTDNAGATVAVNCYDLGVTKAASPAPIVVQGAAITWTVTVTNNGPANMVGPDATSSNPLIVTETFPSTGVGPATLTSSVGPAGVCTLAAPTVTCPGSLNAGQQQVLTFTQPVNGSASVGSTISNTASVADARAGDSNDSATASTQVAAAPRITLRKSLGGQSRASSSDQFVMTITGPGGGSATTSGTGSTITGGAATVATGTPGVIYTLSEAMAAGSATTLGQYANAITCTNAFTGSSTILPAGPGTSFTLTPRADDFITCTLTNTPQPAQVQVAKTTIGGAGSFDFTMSNLSAASTSVATGVAGTPVASLPFTVTSPSSNVVITETVPPGWRLTGGTCMDANSAVTGNAGTFGTFAGNAVTVQASFLEPEADITCTFTNEKLARLVVQKTASGGSGSFTFVATGGLVPPVFSLSPNPPTTPSVSQVFDNLVPGTYTVTEGASAPFRLSDLTCVAAGTSAPGSVVTTDVPAGQFSATLVAGADYTCTFTNVRDAQVTVVKSSIGGDNTFTFTTSGSGNPTDPAPSITTSSGTGSSTFVVPFGPGVADRTVTISESAPPAGWVLTGITCTDAAGSTVGTVSLPTVTIVATPGESFNCNFRNDRLPRVTIIKQSIDGTATFDFTGGTNGLPASLALDTAGSNPSVSAVYQLTAFGTATSITETIPANYDLTSAVCADANMTPVATTLIGETLTIDASAVVGGADLSCTFVNTLRAAQVRVDKRWLGAVLGDQVSIAATGGVNTPRLVSVADTGNEVDAGTPATVYAGETLTLGESFDIGAPANYDSSVVCTGAADTDVSDGLSISAADDGADIVCVYTNSGIPTATKTSGTVSGPDPSGVYTVAYTVAVDNPGASTTYGSLVDSADFAPNLQVRGASWTASASAGPAPAGGSSIGAGSFVLASPSTPIPAASIHTFDVLVSFEFSTYTAATACGGPGTGLYNSVSMASPEFLTTDNSACAVPPSPPAPSLVLVKSASPAMVSAAGQTIAYSFLVTNTGNVTLTGVGVSDPLPGLSTVTCPVSVLAPSASTTCTATYTVTQADVDAGAVDNTATGSATPPTGPGVSDTDSFSVTASRTPLIDLQKSASPATVSAAGESVSYSFVVTNTGNVTLSGVGVSDPLPGLSTVSCPASSLLPAGSMTCTASYSVTQADVDAGAINNTATASGTSGGAGTASDTDPNTVGVVQGPSIDVVKSASPSRVSAAGQTIAYSFVVTNTGNVSLSGVAVSDPLPGLSAVTCPTTLLAPAAATTCTATYMVTQTDVDAGVINNTAAAVGAPPTGPVVTDSDVETVTASPVPSIVVVKSATPMSVSAAGQTISYSFVVTNTGNVTLSSVGVSDPLPGLSTVTCPASVLAPAASTTCAATYVTTQADVDAGAVDNTATAAGTPPRGGVPVSDVDSTTVTASAAPSIDLVKSATPVSVSVAGQTVSYSFVVTNTGNVTLSGVGVSDPLPGLSAVTCPVSALAPAASTTCTATYTTTQVDVDAGAINNTATAMGTPPGGGAAVSDVDSATVTASPVPSIEVLKSATPNNVTTAGQTINYSFVVTNTGNVTLSGVGVSDPLPGLSTVTCPTSVLAPDGSMTCTATYTVTQGDVNAGAINNTATVTGTPPTGPTVSDTDAATVTAANVPAIQVVKSASPTTLSVAGQAVTYSFVVTNTGNVTLTGVTVSDPLPGLSAVSCPASTLAPSVSTTCTATYTATQSDVDAGAVNNTATVTGAPPAGPAVTDVDSETVLAPSAASIDLAKSASPATVTAAGQTVTYSFAITNTGNVTLSGVGVFDPLPGLSGVSCPVTVLAPAASTTCTAAYTTTQPDVDAGVVNNAAVANGVPPSGPAVADTDSETVTATPAPSIRVVKSAVPSTVSVAGQTVAYSFVVTNTGNVTLSGIGVSDPLPGLSAVSCPVSVLAPGASTTCTASYVVTQSDVDAGAINNTATTTGTPASGGAPVSDTDAVTVSATAAPSIDLDKSASPNNVTAAGQTVNYSFVVTNTGNVTLTAIAVTDPLPGLSAVVCPVSVLAPAASTTCTASYVATETDVNTGSIDNTATVTGTPPAGPAVADTGSETVTATNAPAVQVVKTASPTTVSAAGQIVNYSFVVTNTGNVTLTAIVVTDPLPGLTPVSCPSTVLAPSASTTCTASYTATQADVDAGVVNNTASVTASPPTGPDVADVDSASVTAPAAPRIDLVKTATPSSVATAGQAVAYSFVVTNTGNVSLSGVVVSDPLPGLSAVSCPATALSPAGSMTCTASYTVTQADVDAGAVNNTAAVTGTPPAGPVVADTDAETVIAPAAPAVNMVKSASPTTVSAAGQTIVYSFLVTNTGNVTLSGVGVSDPLPGLSTVSCPVSVLAPSASTTCTATYAVTQGDVDAGGVANTATGSGTPPAGRPLVSDTDSVSVSASSGPTIDVQKSASPSTVSAAGQTIAYSFVVTNTGNVTLTGVGVSDPLPGLSAVSCPVSVLAPAGSMTCTATYAVTQVDVDAGAVNNTVTVSGTPPSGPAVSDADPNTVVVVQGPSIDLVKSASPSTVSAAGQTITYRFVVTNTGNVSLSGVAVNDPLPGLSAVACPVTSLAPAAATTCTATYTATQADADAGAVINTATVSASPPGGGLPVTDSGSATVTVTPLPAIRLVKTVAPTVVQAVGDRVTFTFVATNTGSVTLNSVVVTDVLPGLSAVTCPGFSGTLAPAGSVTCTATYAVTQSDLNNGVINNSASVAGSSALTGAQVTGAGAVSVAVQAAPALTLTKSVSASVVSTGATVTYTLVAANTGTLVLTRVVVTDPLVGLSALNCGAFDGTLDPGESVTCTATYRATASGRVTNTAAVSGTSPSGSVINDTATVELTVVNANLPRTGADSHRMLVIAFVLTGAGAIMFFSRRRRTAT